MLARQLKPRGCWTTNGQRQACCCPHFAQGCGTNLYIFSRILQYPAVVSTALENFKSCMVSGVWLRQSVGFKLKPSILWAQRQIALPKRNQLALHNLPDILQLLVLVGVAGEEATFPFNRLDRKSEGVALNTVVVTSHLWGVAKSYSYP